MSAVFNIKLTLVWLVLIIATALSWQFGHGLGFGNQLHYATVAILVITFIKVRFIYLDFMELKTAPRALRWVVEAWALVVCVTLIGLYWTGL